MRGYILGINNQQSQGVILVDNDQRYYFTPADWKEESTPPCKGMIVDFEPLNTGPIKHALNIYMIPQDSGNIPESIINFFSNKNEQGNVSYQQGQPLSVSANYVKFSDSIKYSLHHYVTFSGRASRREFWYFFIFVLICAAGSAIFGPLGALIDCFIIPPFFAVSSRRLHDAGFSGWLSLLWLTAIGGFVLVILLACPSEENKALLK